MEVSGKYDGTLAGTLDLMVPVMLPLLVILMVRVCAAGVYVRSVLNVFVPPM
jgi:hypothetical protein